MHRKVKKKLACCKMYACTTWFVESIVTKNPVKYFMEELVCTDKMSGIVSISSKK